MKTLTFSIIAGLALFFAATAGAQVKRSFDTFGAAFDSASHESR